MNETPRIGKLCRVRGMVGTFQVVGISPLKSAIVRPVGSIGERKVRPDLLRYLA